MEIYLASRYNRFKEMQGYAHQLEVLGHEVTSRWIKGDHQMDDGNMSTEAVESERIRFANEDVEDLNRADTVICFTEKPRTTKSRGGRHVEMGMAIAWEKDVYVIGYRENVFCCLPEIKYYKTFDDLLKNKIKGLK